MSETLVLPRDKPETKKIRDIITLMLKTSWKSLNEYTSSLNASLPILKSIVATLISQKSDQQLPRSVHEQSIQINANLESMVKVVKTLKGVAEELEKVIAVEEKQRPGASFESPFATVPLVRFYEVLSYVADCYEKETLIKSNACKALPKTNDEDTLNAAITLWSNHLYLPEPHLYHIKILLYEARLL